MLQHQAYYIVQIENMHFVPAFHPYSKDFTVCHSCHSSKHRENTPLHNSEFHILSKMVIEYIVIGKRQSFHLGSCKYIAQSPHPYIFTLTQEQILKHCSAPANTTRFSVGNECCYSGGLARRCSFKY